MANDDLKGFGLAQLKQEPTEEEHRAILKEASRLWAEQSARRDRAEEDKWLRVVGRARDLLNTGSPLEEALAVVREEYQGYNSDDPERWDE